MAPEKSRQDVVERLLAEGLRHSGQNAHERAAQCWRQVLALDPGNLAAAECLGSTDAPWAPTTASHARSEAGTEAGADAVDLSDRRGSPRSSGSGTNRISTFDARYEVGRVLGGGGMGEVWVCTDRELSRPVAVKFMREAVHLDPVLRARFDRETRIQGQLQHPGVVPVHERGLLPSGIPYFAMQQVRGLTLADVLDGIEADDAAVIADFPVERLLSDFVRVCLTVAFAHSQLVIHRDLKPENIMLGEFGEVYVLDWGIAKLGGLRDSVEPAPPGASEPSRPSAPDRLAGSHAQEHLLLPTSTALDGPGPEPRVGTPSYMAPEQATEEGEAIDLRADIYALGAILFEILTGERLNGGTTSEDALSTAASDARPRIELSIRQGRLPAELGALVLKATERDLSRRLASARELGNRVQGLLRGNRSQSDRREQARIHRLAAQVALAHSRTEQGLSPAARVKAIRSLHLAVALDPEDGASYRTLVGLLGQAEAELPAAAQAELAAERSAERAAASRLSARLLLGVFLLQGAIVLAGVKSWGAFLPCLVLGVVTPCWIAAMGYRGWVRPVHYLISGSLGALLAASFGVVFGPLFLAPVLCATYLFVVVVQSRAEAPLRAGLAFIGLFSILLPVALMVLDVTPNPYTFAGGQLHIESPVTSLSASWSYGFMAVAALLFLSLPLYLAGRAIDRLRAAEQRLFAHVWTLRELIPPPEESDGALDIRQLTESATLARRAARSPTPPRISEPDWEW